MDISNFLHLNLFILSYKESFPPLVRALSKAESTFLHSTLFSQGDQLRQKW